MTLALKLGASGRRKSSWRGGSMARSMLRIRSSCVGGSVLEHDPALAGREQPGLAGDVDDVGVLEHGPVAGLAGDVLPVHRVGAPQLGEGGVWRPGDVGVRGVEVDGGRGRFGVAGGAHRRSGTSGTTSARTR